MRKLIGGLIILTLLLASCVGSVNPIESVPNEPNKITIPNEPSETAEPSEPEEVTENDSEVVEEPIVDEEPADDKPIVPDEKSPKPEIVLQGEPPDNVTWISPGKVNIGNYYPGGRAEYPVTIHNGKDTVASFSVTYRYPDHVGKEYDKPPLEAQDWIIIADMTPVLAPKETKDVLVVLAIPEGATIDSKRWEFWVSVMDVTQRGTVRTELAVRWLVSMR